MMPFTLRWQLEIAFEAMALQYERLCESARYRPDAYLFAVALAQVVKAAEITDGALGSVETRAALKSFRAAFPHATDVRNVVEHWEAYAEGKGRLQKRGGFGPVDLLNVTENKRRELVLEVGPPEAQHPASCVGRSAALREDRAGAGSKQPRVPRRAVAEP